MRWGLGAGLSLPKVVRQYGRLNIDRTQIISQVTKRVDLKGRGVESGKTGLVRMFEVVVRGA